MTLNCFTDLQVLSEYLQFDISNHLMAWYFALDYIYEEDQWQNTKPDIIHCVCDSIKLVEVFLEAILHYIVSRCLTCKVLCDLIFECSISPHGNGACCDIEQGTEEVVDNYNN